MGALRITGNAMIAFGIYYLTILGLYGSKDVGAYMRRASSGFVEADVKGTMVSSKFQPAPSYFETPTSAIGTAGGNY